MRPPMTAKLVEFHEIAPDVRQFLFELQDAESFGYVPGQFVSFTAEIDGSPITRAYSLASPPRGSRFELCLNRVAEGKFSPYLFAMRSGDCVQMTGPWGKFIFRQPVDDSILVATGSGVVPFRAMLQDQLAKDNSHQFTLLHGARYESGLLFKSEFEDLAQRHSNFHFVPTLSRPGPDWSGLTGRVQRHLFEVIGDRRNVNVFICGLKAMVDDVRAILKANGFDRKQIFHEKYD
jgi:CDP-4-dehydro-6-deoxyglucose reductase